MSPNNQTNEPEKRDIRAGNLLILVGRIVVIGLKHLRAYHFAKRAVHQVKLDWTVEFVALARP